jgi:hypothetical protein
MPHKYPLRGRPGAVKTRLHLASWIAATPGSTAPPSSSSVAPPPAQRQQRISQRRPKATFSERPLTRGDVGDAVGVVHLLDGRDGVSSTHDGGRPLVGRQARQDLRDTERALSEPAVPSTRSTSALGERPEAAVVRNSLGHLEDTGGSVPNDRLAVRQLGLEAAQRLGTNVQTHPALGHTLRQRRQPCVGLSRHVHPGERLQPTHLCESMCARSSAPRCRTCQRRGCRRGGRCGRPWSRPRP